MEIPSELAWSEEARERLDDWRRFLRPLTMDIVGDFAGEELFAIHGEALVAHCIQAARVDYGYGFQLLHAVHAIESFLRKMVDRGCNFHIVWFDRYSHLCIPCDVPEGESYKYLLTRAVMIQHLARGRAEDAALDTGSGRSLRFKDINHDSFLLYLKQTPLHFFMCRDDGATHLELDAGILDRLTVAYQMACNGYRLAFIDNVEFRSSKVNASVVTPSPDLPPLVSNVQSEVQRDVSKSENRPRLEEVVHLFQERLGSRRHSSREVLTVHALSQVLRDGASQGLRRQAASMLLHLVLLRHLDISQRSLEQLEMQEGHHKALRDFSEAALNVLDEWTRENVHEWEWDVYDLVDGRLYLHVLQGLTLTSLPKDIVEEFTDFAELIKVLSCVDVSQELPNRQVGEGAKKQQSKTHTGGDSSTSSVLPFSQPVMDQYLQQVHLATEQHSGSSTSQVFRELTHWHNTKKTIDPKHIPKAPDFRIRRRNQRFMADTIAYSASLTGSSGKNIDPEVIVVNHSDEGKSQHIPQVADVDRKTAVKNKQGSKKKPQQQKSGRQKALDEARNLKAEKVENKSITVIASWEKWCAAELKKGESLTTKYLQAAKYLRELSPTNEPFIGAPTSLYICYVLNVLLGQGGLPESYALDATAMLWAQIIETNRFPLTKDAMEQLSKLTTSLNMTVGIQPTSESKPIALPFSIRRPTRIPGNISPHEFQLDHCGPYMERSFDSAPDPRVPFHPDAWQRRVLDAIDAEKSLFVVAPTSAGKTFISFYAMKKVLKANDTDVIVYVAPTKALVNQIAAEVQARFQKSYHSNQEGHSVWAIHTRDYRVNNSTGCQILITVPHILQIMLLAPSMAKGPNSWARRVKRIIFDEVHCIGQAEDGIIWEQLLLLAPCPIIALSATVGNPAEFKEWLEGTQRVKGFNLEMITHESRYSDLRKFIYEPPQGYRFDGLRPVERLPFPGLDSGEASMGGRFSFIHPISGLIPGNLSALNDTAFEPRDCLSLWRCLPHGDKTQPNRESLDPERFLTNMIKKSDVVEWERALKQKLGVLMLNSRPEFQAIEDALSTSVRKPTKDEEAYSQDSSRSCPSSHLALILDLRSKGALPAIIFDYDRMRCQKLVFHLHGELTSAENEYRESPGWKAKIKKFEEYEKGKNKAQAKSAKRPPKNQGKDGDGTSKDDMLRDKASEEVSRWQNFDPDAPISRYSLADETKISKEELEERLSTLDYHPVKPEFIDALRRGLGVHHAGMNRQYRQVVEMLFRKGYLTVVVGTGTLALGLNMPCKTVVFSGDSVFLTALQYRQASGRAGRRGFDVLGNIVFHGISHHRVLEITSSQLPKLRGQFPTSVTLILRLFSLLHGTNNSDYACRAVKSLLSQSRLYLGGPDTKLAIEHHLRFSIDYLRRQHLLSETGIPLNFCGLVGHLYYTENAAFAFHSLLKEGYFHKLCAQIDRPERLSDILLTLIHVMSHLFCRIPCHRHEDKKWLENVVRKSPSVILLPALPKDAERVLRQHNRETLGIFKNYVESYATQYLADSPDHELPFTKYNVKPRGALRGDLQTALHPLPAVVVASSFAALSGADDSFTTIGELCRDVRSGVFLEESTIPHVPLAPDETDGVPWNAYLYDFFKHGDLVALKRDNGIKEGDVWFLLKDFSLILATIVTSLNNFLSGVDADEADAAMTNVQDAGDIIAENAGIDLGEDAMEHDKSSANRVPPNASDIGSSNKKKGHRKPVVESWDDELSDDGGDEQDNLDDSCPHHGKQESKSPSSDDTSDTGLPSWAHETQGESLAKVYMAFRLLQSEFDTKFKKIGA